MSHLLNAYFFYEYSVPITYFTNPNTSLNYKHKSHHQTQIRREPQTFISSCSCMLQTGTTYSLPTRSHHLHIITQRSQATQVSNIELHHKNDY